MTTEAAFSAQDAQVAVADKDTELAWARSAVAFLDTQIVAAQDVLGRLHDKLSRFQSHITEVETEIHEAEVAVEDLTRERDTHRGLVRVHAPEEEF
jgi:chromosome segregation ATPase